MFFLNFTYPVRCFRVPQVEYHVLDYITTTGKLNDELEGIRWKLSWCHWGNIAYLERQRKTVENVGLYTGALAEFPAEHFPNNTLDLYYYGSTALYLDLRLVFSFWILYTIAKTHCTGDQFIARLLPTHRTQRQKNTHRHPSLEWDSNRRPQSLDGRSQFMPYTARPLWSDPDIVISSLFSNSFHLCSSLWARD
jgi:hypothetical protein